MPPGPCPLGGPPGFHQFSPMTKGLAKTLYRFMERDLPRDLVDMILEYLKLKKRIRFVQALCGPPTAELLRGCYQFGNDQTLDYHGYQLTPMGPHLLIDHTAYIVHPKSKTSHDASLLIMTQSKRLFFIVIESPGTWKAMTHIFRIL